MAVLAAIVGACESSQVHRRTGAGTSSPAQPPESVARTPATFRLGNAAAPFGWSTVVGDFDTDGQPDVAVADHIPGGSDRYAYRLDFSIGGQAIRHVTFESTHDAINLRLVDVDRDDDLDLVVGTPLSGETVAVWLNDGHGHFTEGDLRHLPSTIGSEASLGSSDSTTVAGVVEWSSRFSNTAAPSQSPFFPRPIRQMFGRCHRSLARSALHAAAAKPRAPPVDSAALLS